MNTELAELVINHIEEEPRRLDMDVWGSRVYPTEPHEPPCGTICCLAGWTVVLGSEEGKDFLGNHGYLTGDTEEEAAWLLKITPQQAQGLFHTVNWPTEFWSSYNNAKNQKERTQVTIDRFRHFIETEE